MEDFLWLIVLIGAPIVLGALIAFGMMQRRNFSGREQNLRNKTIRKLYHDNSDM